ncbi:sulfite exporter TauE/SafE family protein [Flavihumibacter fluvii]|uniref:sulfite exporter TauE/SafE family protein n=1 Tax=Flavihumibacter fluvii TaxID=2838157 RepID=UPI001BDF223E|nr:sulfite exporter TauE/SafE family protein [Flavihumibacter fluvii]ULQ50609.1 sulfite exporter TauE/SafE family protein [Flavihumibacter fluvii]
MVILGYLASLVIGLSLGLIGGGGSILTVPVLVYLFHVNPVIATAYSLFIVGTTSLVGAVPKYRQGDVDLKTALIFGIPSITAVFITRKFIVPAIPHEIFTINSLVVTKPIFMMVLFALLMIVAAIIMLRNQPMANNIPINKTKGNTGLTALQGAMEGSLTGLVGAGGGFLIIPVLVLFSKLPMKKAIGTSLLIIAVKSLIGFTGDLGHTNINWTLLLTVSVLAIAGIFIGNRFSKKVAADQLKKGFGWFVLAMGIYIIIHELFIGSAH